MRAIASTRTAAERSTRTVAETTDEARIALDSAVYDALSNDLSEDEVRDRVEFALGNARESEAVPA